MFHSIKKKIDRKVKMEMSNKSCRLRKEQNKKKKFGKIFFLRIVPKKID